MWGGLLCQYLRECASNWLNLILYVNWTDKLVKEIDILIESAQQSSDKHIRWIVPILLQTTQAILLETLFRWAFSI